MTDTAVMDASCLIDLRKVALLHVFKGLDYRFLVPLPIWENELQKFTDLQWQSLIEGGVTPYDLPGEQVAQAAALRQEHSGLSLKDCSALVLAAGLDNAILLTGDASLRKSAEARGVQVHGSLWLIEQLHDAKACPCAVLISTLQIWQQDETVFLPAQEIAKLLRKLRRAR